MTTFRKERSPMKSQIGRFFGAFLLEILLVLGLVLLGLIAYYYASANTTVFSDWSIIAYGEGWEKFWLGLYLGSDIVFFIIVLICFLELCLWLGRTAIKLGIVTQEKMTGISHEIAKKNLGKISLLTFLFLKGPSKLKTGLILYFAVILGVLGFGWIGKTILKETDSLVYRAHELINLESETSTFDLEEEIENDTPVDVSVTTNVGVVHLYSVSDVTEANIYYLYDTEVQRANFSIVYENNIFTIVFHDEVAEYHRYVDPVLPSVEIYLPKNVHVDNVEVNIHNYGYFTTEYLALSSLKVQATNSQISIKSPPDVTGDFEIEATNSTLDITMTSANELKIRLEKCSATMSFGAVAGGLDLMSKDADILLHSTTPGNLTIISDTSKIELRELYSPTVLIEVEQTNLLYHNGNPDYSYSSFIITPTGEKNVFSLKGVPLDTN